MSTTSSARTILVILLASFGLPLLFLLFLFEYLEISEYVLPILLPIFGFTLLMLIVIFGFIFGAIKWASGKAGTMQYQHSPRITTTMHHAQRKFYLIPVNCPHCQSEIELGRAEWRDDRTIICSRCFTDIEIQKT